MPNGYININKHGKENEYYFVPSYTNKIARMDLDQATKDMKSQTAIDGIMHANVSRACHQQANNADDSPDVKQYKDRIAELENAVRILQRQRNKDEKGKTNDQNEEATLGLILSWLNRFTIQSDKYHCENPKACKDFFGSTHGNSVEHS